MEHNFERYNLKPFLIEALNENKITLPTEIQERLIPAVSGGQDAIGKSQTGTGKTLAFLLPILNKIESSEMTTQSIVIAPTRELAQQLFEVFKAYSDKSPEKIHAQLIVGGTDRLRMLDKVQHQPHLVIGTPGRILDMFKSNAINPNTVQSLVIDEADQMLEMGFLEDVDSIASKLDKDLQILVFSATIPEKLKPFLKKYLKNPKQVEVDPKQTSPNKMQHWLLSDKDKDRLQVLTRITDSIQPFLALVFTNTKEKANEVYKVLQSKGLDVECIHGDVPPRQRKKVLKKLQDAEVQYVVATDLIARGIDVKGITHIINFELPTEIEYYVHRVGRTARAGWGGTAITIYGREDEDAINQLIRKKIHFEYKELVKGEWTTIEKRNFHRRTKVDPANRSKVYIRESKKVKPGYKKKLRTKIERQAQRERRINSRKK